MLGLRPRCFRKCDLAPDGPVFTRFGAMADQISRKTTLLTGPWHACARLYQSPTPKHMGCLLDKNRRRRAPAVSSIPLRCQMLQLSWLRTQQMSCLQPRLPPAVFVQQTTHVLRVSSRRNGRFLYDGSPPAAHPQRNRSGRDAQLGPGGRRTQQEPFAGRSREKSCQGMP